MKLSRLLFASLILPALAVQVSAAPKDPPPGKTAEKTPAFEITTKRSNDVVTATVKNDEALIEITSPFGISEADIKRPGDKWPKKITLRLNLRGLEGFGVSTDKKKGVGVSILSHSGYKQINTLPDGGKGEDADKKSPYLIDVKRCDKDGKSVKGLPPKGGYFEMELPAVLFKDNPERLFLGWIDFYRG